MWGITSLDEPSDTVQIREPVHRSGKNDVMACVLLALWREVSGVHCRWDVRYIVDAVIGSNGIRVDFRHP